MQGVKRGMDKLAEGKLAYKDPSERNGPGSTIRMGKATQVKNKSAAPIQITAEQILREAHEHKESPILPPRQQITDPEELKQYMMRKRKEFEDTIRRSRNNMGAWTKYAMWEANLKEFERAESVFERALQIDSGNQTVWLKYAEMLQKNRLVNKARNVWDRAVQLLLRVDQFWLKYSYMEEMLGNISGARAIFERWMKWEPDFTAWYTFIRFETRHNNIDRARAIFERLVMVHPEVKTYLKWAKWETKLGQRARARTVFERAFKDLGEEANKEELFMAFAAFEENAKEYERARAVFKYALDHVPKHRAEKLFQAYSQFEKKHGDRQNLEDVIISKRRFQYEEQFKSNPLNYDTWFDYIRLEENTIALLAQPTPSALSRVREVYERAIGSVPPVTEKRYWERYVYLWIFFAVFEELTAKDVERTRAIYQKLLETIPHARFSFAKVWIMAADFEVRQKNLEGARKLLGRSIGLCPTPKVFKHYIHLEQTLGNIDRCRKLYEKNLEFQPQNCLAWSRYASLEASLAEHERARALFELGVSQTELDMPEMLWKAYIDFELTIGEHARVRQLYGRLLARTKHVKVHPICSSYL